MRKPLFNIEKRRNIEIMVTGIIVIAFGVELLREQIVNFLYYVIKPTPLQFIWESMLPIFFMVSGIFFLLLKKWAFYLVRTISLLIILVGFLEIISAIFIGFIGLPSFLLYLMMLAAGASLNLIGRTEVKERFGIRK